MSKSLEAEQTRREQIAHRKFNYQPLFGVSSLDTQIADTTGLLTLVLRAYQLPANIVPPLD